jgi:Arc/MetJ-type ribon-helix-helix transcriptional regulator
MKKLSVSIEEDHVGRLDELQEDGDATSRSDALRHILDEYEEMRTEYDELRTVCEDLHTQLESREERIDQLEEQLARRSQVEEKVDVLARRVEDTTEPDPPFFVRWAQWWRSRGDRDNVAELEETAD